MIVILHNIRSLYNVGSIFRTADAVGAEKIYLCGITPSPVDVFGKLRPQLTKVSLGAEKSVEWDASACSARGITKLIKSLKKSGYKIFAIEQSKKSIPYYKLSNLKLNNLKTALVIGNEVNGLSPAILKQVDKILEIPMRGKMVKNVSHPRRTGHGKESLNVSVAFGIVAFHIANQSKFNKKEYGIII